MLRQALPTTNQAMTAAVPFLCWSLSDLSYDVVSIPMLVVQHRSFLSSGR